MRGSRRYASLYFLACVDDDDNELIVLETIHHFVEVLDRYFGNVCELDLIFNFHKAYHILDELLITRERPPELSHGPPIWAAALLGALPPPRDERRLHRRAARAPHPSPLTPPTSSRLFTSQASCRNLQRRPSCA